MNTADKIIYIPSYCAKKIYLYKLTFNHLHHMLHSETFYLHFVMSADVVHWLMKEFQTLGLELRRRHGATVKIIFAPVCFVTLLYPNLYSSTEPCLLLTNQIPGGLKYWIEGKLIKIDRFGGEGGEP